MIFFVGYSKGPEQLQSAATTTSAGREPGTIHISSLRYILRHGRRRYEWILQT